MAESLKLYYSTTSPFVRKVLIMLHELKLIQRTELIRGLTPEALANHPNPVNRIPVLITPEDGVIIDSNIICEYLDQKYNNGVLFLKNTGIARFSTLSSYGIADGLIETLVSMVYEYRRPADKISDTVLQGYKLKITKALEYSEGHVIDFNDWNIATITLICAWDYLLFRFADRFKAESYSKLVKWRKQFNQESLILTMPRES